MNLMMLLEMASAGFGERVALTCGDVQLSYQELMEAARSVAGELADSGCERMATLDVSSPAVPIGLFASAWAGLPFVPLNYRLTGAELDALIERVTPAFLVTEADRVEPLSRLPDTRVVAREDFLSRARDREAMRGKLPADSSWSMDPDEIAILLFTSGTTGAPKAAVLRHKHLVSYILASVEFGSAGEDDAALVSVPPYHIAGMAAIASSIYSGRRIVQLANFSAEAWLEAARAERVSHAFVVPTMLARIVEALEGESSARLPALRALSYGGGKMPQSVIERAMRLLPDAAFANAYGLTEASSTIALLGPDDHRAALASEDPAVRQRLVSVGRPLPSVEIEIRDPLGAALPAGKRGEIFVRGEQVSGEYLGRGSTLVEEGWFPTKDGGFLDAEGYLFVDGRIDDIIVRGGENLSPGEIEETLREHAGVADCAVVGIPDERWGEAVAAVIVPRSDAPAPSEAELQSFVKERLRSSRTPERIEFRDSLPYNETVKLLRRQVRSDLVGEGR